MKKILLALMVMSVATSVYAADVDTTATQTTASGFFGKYTQKMREIGQKLDQTSNDIDAKILEQEKKALEQQKKYEAEKAAREAKILEQKREQLRILLEE